MNLVQYVQTASFPPLAVSDATCYACAMLSPSKKHCFVSPHKLNSNVCSMCGYVVLYPAYTRPRDANVLMDNHMNLAHPIPKRCGGMAAHTQPVNSLTRP